MLAELAVPVQVICSTQRDHYRKPLGGMWDFLEKEANGGVTVDRTASFYVGDAAGGEGEHSAADSEFAHAVGVKFVHARDFFGSPGTAAAASGAAQPSAEGSPAKVRRTSGPGGAGLAATVECGVDGMCAPRAGSPAVLVLAGAPGCGKTTLGARFGPPYSTAAAAAGATPWLRICQDLLRTKEACLKAASECLDRGVSVVIDRTNYDKDQRAMWVNLASSRRAACHCLAFDVPLDVCVRRVRERTSHEGKLAGGAASLVVRRLFSLMRPVSPEEGFGRVRIVRTAEDCNAEATRYLGGEEAVAMAPPPMARGPVEPSAALGDDAVRSLEDTCREAAAAVPPQSTDVVGVKLGTASVAVAVAATGPQEAAPPQSTDVNVGVKPATASATVVVAATGPQEPMTSTNAGAGGCTASAVIDADDPKVEALGGLGFPADACRAALAAVGGDANLAGNLLLREHAMSDEGSG
eukprot:NODE_3950_length_1957_cov_6.338798.p1 GENE.NODE_3950_length_1957_cov_6.338798~~NODE_3950_length_1957_cov_6.338798.p1  ORF type:complete len:467 (-),score=126.85 NODE_3950_length_1957_cov_6.338798:23-1423(-)